MALKKTHWDEVASSFVSEEIGGGAVIVVGSSLTPVAFRRRRFLCDDSSTWVSMQIVSRISTQAFTLLRASSFGVVGRRQEALWDSVLSVSTVHHT
jgi:hypothetical protein